MIPKHLKIGRPQPEKSWNMFQRIQILKKSRAIVFDFLNLIFKYIKLFSPVDEKQHNNRYCPPLPSSLCRRWWWTGSRRRSWTAGPARRSCPCRCCPKIWKQNKNLFVISTRKNVQVSSGLLYCILILYDLLKLLPKKFWPKIMKFPNLRRRRGLQTTVRTVVYNHIEKEYGWTTLLCYIYNNYSKCLKKLIYPRLHFYSVVSMTPQSQNLVVLKFDVSANS